MKNGLVFMFNLMQSACLLNHCYGWTFDNFNGFNGTCILKGNDVCCNQVPTLPKVTNVGLQILVHKYWFTKIGSRKLVHENWFTKIGSRKLVHENWFTKIGSRKLVHKFWFTNFVLQIFVHN
jgi:hypothetical protein